MPVNVRRLRAWFAIAVLAIVIVIAAFYVYGRLAFRINLPASSRNLGLTIQQSTQGFSLSKSEAGRTLFTVRAEKATQYAEGGRAELHEVSILIYGRESNRFDQIYGSDFEYDPASGEVKAKGVVHIDLQSNAGGAGSPDQALPEEMKNPVHVTTSGLVFNQKTGNAQTRERVEFRIPQASGSADGATYDSKLSQLSLHSNINISSNDPAPTRITAQRGVIARQPREIVLYRARIERQNGAISAGQLTAFLRDDNSVDRIFASEEVQSEIRGATMVHVRAPRAWLFLKGNNEIRWLNLQGGTSFQAVGANTLTGSADNIAADFKGHNLLDKVRALGNVKLVQPPAANAQAKSAGSGPAQTVEVAADIIDFWIRNGRNLQRAETSNKAQITLTPVTSAASPGRSTGTAPQPERTVVTAGKFYASMNPQNRLHSLTGYPEAKVVSYIGAKPQRTSASRLIEVEFGPAGEVGKIVQRDNFEYHESLANGSERAAWAEWATYLPENEVLTLNGKPRVIEGGMTTTARVIRLDRRSGAAHAEGEVKSTYSEMRPPDENTGSASARAEPVHVTARSMTTQQGTGIAHYTGNARMWQGPNIVEAATIDFDRSRHTMTAQDSLAAKGSPVSTMLVHQDRSGKPSPVTVTSKLLTYNAIEHVARFAGNVRLRSSEGNLTANKADAYFQATRGKGNDPNGQSNPISFGGTAQSQLDQIIAEGNVRLQQPKREGTGEKLVYTAADEKYVLTGGSPSIFDADRGTIRGASLTFYSHDDRVLVEGSPSSRTVTNTRVSK